MAFVTHLPCVCMVCKWRLICKHTNFHMEKETKTRRKRHNECSPPSAPSTPLYMRWCYGFSKYTQAFERFAIRRPGNWFNFAPVTAGVALFRAVRQFDSLCSVCTVCNFCIWSVKLFYSNFKLLPLVENKSNSNFPFISFVLFWGIVSVWVWPVTVILSGSTHGNSYDFHIHFPPNHFHFTNVREIVCY